jgi:hypothetical protein
VKVSIDIDIDGLSPRQLREEFVRAIKAEIGTRYAAGDIDLAVAEELLRSQPQEGHA